MVSYWISCSYLTSFARAYPRWPLSNMNVIKKRSAFAKVEIFQQETIEQTFGKPNPRSTKFCDIQQDMQKYE